MPYSKTPAGQAALKERSALLSARRRSALILFDGIKSVDQVLLAMAGLGLVQADIDHLMAQGFLAQPEEAPGPMAAAETVAVSSRTPQERYRDAYPLATQLTASLGLRGFRLNLAVEAASGYEELLALLPKIQAAVGSQSCQAFEQALKA